MSLLKPALSRVASGQPQSKPGSRSGTPSKGGDASGSAQMELDPYRPLPQQLKRPIQTFSPSNPSPSTPTSTQQLLSLTPHGYSTRLANRNLHLVAPTLFDGSSTPGAGPSSSSAQATAYALTEAARAESLRKGKKRTPEQVDFGGERSKRQDAKGRKRKALGIVSKGEARRRKIYKIPKTRGGAGAGIQWEEVQGLWWMHLGYMGDLLGLPAYEGKGKGKAKELEAQDGSAGRVMGMTSEGILGKLVKADLLGAKLTVKRAKNDVLVGISGVVIQESAGTFKLVTRESGIKVIPKVNSLFTLSFPAYALSSLPFSPSPNPTQSVSTTLLNSSLSCADDSPFLLAYDPFSSLPSTLPTPTSSNTPSASAPQPGASTPSGRPGTPVGDFERALEKIPKIEVDILGSAFAFRSEDRAGRRFKPKEGGGGWEEGWVGWWGDGHV